MRLHLFFLAVLLGSILFMLGRCSDTVKDPAVKPSKEAAYLIYASLLKDEFKPEIESEKRLCFKFSEFEQGGESALKTDYPDDSCFCFLPRQSDFKTSEECPNEN